MATKDDCLFFKDKQKDFAVNESQYINLNLNQNNLCFAAENVQTKNFKNQKISNYDNDSQTKQQQNSVTFGKTKLAPSSFTNLNSQKKDYGKKEEKILNNANNSSSTLSLHISAYENSIDAFDDRKNGGEKRNNKKSIKSWKAVKESFNGTSSVNHYAFELPRQQQQNQNNDDPEVMQFKASQQLSNVNGESLMNAEHENIMDQNITTGNLQLSAAPPLQQQPQTSLGIHDGFRFQKTAQMSKKEEEPKKFGLRIIQKPSASTTTLPVASVFGDGNDSDEEIANEKDANKKFQMKYGSNKIRDQRAVDEVIAENPDVYLYDEILDDLHSKRNAKTEEQKEADKKREPKYAHKIVQATQKRQMEKLMVDERKQAREREAEGEEFKDKEAFVTGAYKKQIEERERIRKELEEQDRMDSRLKVEDQSFWQANFNRRLLDDMTEEKPAAAAAAVKVEEKKEKVVEEEDEEDYSKAEQEKKLFQELKPGLNQPKSSTKSKRSPTPEHRSSRRHHDHRRRRSSSYDRKRSTALYKSASHHQRRRRHDSSASSSSSSPSRPSSPASKENGKNENHHRQTTRKKNPKSDKEILYERLEKIKEILKQRNNDSQIFMARQRYLQRKQNGEIRAPI